MGQSGCSGVTTHRSLTVAARKNQRRDDDFLRAARGSQRVDGCPDPARNQINHAVQAEIFLTLARLNRQAVVRVSRPSAPSRSRLVKTNDATTISYDPRACHAPARKPNKSRGSA